MAEKKRKRHGEESNGQPSKRVATEQPSGEVIKVSFVPDENEWTPVVGMTVCARCLQSIPPSLLPHTGRYHC